MKKINNPLELRQLYKNGYNLRIQDRISVERFSKYIGFCINRKKIALDVICSNYKLLKTLPEKTKTIRKSDVKT